MKTKKIRYVISIICISLYLLSGCGKEDARVQVVLTTGFEEDEIFRIGKASCSLAEIKVYLVNMQNQYEGVYGPAIWETSINDKSLADSVKDTVIARMAQVKTMNLLAQEYSVELTEQEKALVDQAAKEYFASLNEAEKETMGVSEEIIAELYREHALANKVYDFIIQDVNPEISDDEARTITIQQILIKTYTSDKDGNPIVYSPEEKEIARKKAEEIAEMAQDGEDFDVLSDKYNEDTANFYSFGQGEMDSQFEEAAFNLATDEISGAVETPKGYRIIKCISTFDRQETDVNKVKIVEERKKEAFNQVYDSFVQSLLRNLNNELWDSVKIVTDENVKTASFFDIYNKYFEV